MYIHHIIYTEKIGISLQSVSCIELGKKAIRPENLANLCNGLEVTSDYILYGKRDRDQMKDTISKLSELSPEEYHVLEYLITLLHSKK